MHNNPMRHTSPCTSGPTAPLTSQAAYTSEAQQIVWRLSRKYIWHTGCFCVTPLQR